MRLRTRHVESVYMWNEGEFLVRFLLWLELCADFKVDGGASALSAQFSNIAYRSQEFATTTLGLCYKSMRVHRSTIVFAVVWPQIREKSYCEKNNWEFYNFFSKLDL